MHYPRPSCKAYFLTTPLAELIRVPHTDYDDLKPTMESFESEDVKKAVHHLRCRALEVDEPVLRRMELNFSRA